ncbi:MAG TPA: response regulator [Rhizomicrobium sp.]|nr:response regulator [Rhizomicrobium sp.]
MAHILLVDDDPLVVEALSDAITNKGHTLVTAINGKEGMKKFAEGVFDLVITDIVMPEKEGIETIMEMRRLVPDVRIVAISGGGRMGNVEFLHMAEKLGATATLKKPIRLAELYEMLERCLANSPEA